MNNWLVTQGIGFAFSKYRCKDVFMYACADVHIQCAVDLACRCDKIAVKRCLWQVSRYFSAGDSSNI